MTYCAGGGSATSAETLKAHFTQIVVEAAAPAERIL